MYELIVIATMLALNAVFAAYEMGIASLSHARVKDLAENGEKGAVQALFMKQRMEGTLSTIQIGITVVGYVAAATGGAGVEKGLAPLLQTELNISRSMAETLSLIIFVAPLSLLTIIFAELTPKMIAIKNNVKIVLLLSPPMKVMFKALYPVIGVIEAVVKKMTSFNLGGKQPNEQSVKNESLGELRAAVSIAKASRLIGKREERIVLSAAELSLRPAGDIMIPLSEVFMIWSGSAVSEAFIKAHQDMHTRFPVYDKMDDPQSISGYINFKDILTAVKMGAEEPTLNTIKRPLKFVDARMSLSQLLEVMVQEKTHIVAVTDESDVRGIITMEDIIEELVGDIEDEYDHVPSSIMPYGSAWIVGGNVSMRLIESVIGADKFDTSGFTEAQTLTEWCIQKLGRFPKGGELIESGCVRVMPRKFRRGKMVEAIITMAV